MTGMWQVSSSRLRKVCTIRLELDSNGAWPVEASEHQLDMLEFGGRSRGAHNPDGPASFQARSDHSLLQ